MNQPTSISAAAIDRAVIERVESILREHAARSEKQLRELESDMVGLLGDSSTIQEDRDGARRLIESVRADFMRTRRALARIDAGTFGRCTVCSEAIAVARLEAIPEAERCSNCA